MLQKATSHSYTFFIINLLHPPHLYLSPTSSHPNSNKPQQTAAVSPPFASCLLLFSGCLASWCLFIGCFEDFWQVKCMLALGSEWKIHRMLILSYLRLMSSIRKRFFFQLEKSTKFFQPFIKAPLIILNPCAVQTNSYWNISEKFVDSLVEKCFFSIKSPHIRNT